MAYTVKVRQFDEDLAVEMGQTILEAALARDLPYPHGCRSGNCGACKSELVAGEVEMSPYSEFALTEQEKAGGLILACRAVPWSDCEVRFLDAEDVVAHPSRRLTCKVASVADATHDIRVVRMEIRPAARSISRPGNMRASSSPACRRATIRWRAGPAMHFLSFISA